jgi:radical SAM protein with 4Fe4S-binding SPASM domain
VKDNILGFLDERERLGRHKPFVKLHILKMKETLSEIDGFIREWKPLLGKGDRILIKYLHDFGGMVTDIALQAGIWDMRRPCFQLWRTLIVSWNGDIMPCGICALKQLKIGNVETTPIKDLWSNPSLQALREIHLRGEYDKIPICKSCGTRWYFGKKPKEQLQAYDKMPGLVLKGKRSDTNLSRIKLY